ncbi:hypothetical protein D8S78_15665 [Natrialba swarupiae]|nr:hypothetical protein [Natrialba swarupiae]
MSSFGTGERSSGISDRRYHVIPIRMRQIGFGVYRGTARVVRDLSQDQYLTRRHQLSRSEI